MNLGKASEKINSGKTPLGGESTYTTEGVVFIRSQNVNNDKLELNNTVFISEEVNNSMKNSVVRANDILLNITGASLGRCCVVPTDFETGNVNQHVCIIRLKDGYNPRFIQPKLSSSKGQNIFLSLQTGSGREGLNFESIKSIELDFPRKNEQDKIARFLSLIDQRIETQNKIIEDLETLIQNLREKLFMQKLMFNNDNGEGFPKWKVMKLGEIGDIVSGLTYNPNEIDEKGVLVLRSSNVQRRALTFDDNVFVSVSKYNPVLEDDILICVRNGSKDLIGKNAIIKKEHAGYAFGAFMTIYRSIYNKFVFQWFDTEQYKSEVHKNLGATINSINGRDLKNFKVPFPSKIEQAKIANFLSSIDNKIEMEKSILSQYKSQKKYLLRNIFT